MFPPCMRPKPLSKPHKPARFTLKRVYDDHYDDPDIVRLWLSYEQAQAEITKRAGSMGPLLPIMHVAPDGLSVRWEGADPNGSAHSITVYAEIREGQVE